MSKFIFIYNTPRRAAGDTIKKDKNNPATELREYSLFIGQSEYLQKWLNNNAQ